MQCRDLDAHTTHGAARYVNEGIGSYKPPGSPSARRWLGVGFCILVLSTHAKDRIVRHTFQIDLLCSTLGRAKLMFVSIIGVQYGVENSAT